MSRWKKIVIGLLVLLNLVVGGITYYAVQVTADASKMVDNIRQTVKRTSLKREGGEKPNIDNAEPFSILLAGVDTGDLGRSDQGRSDSMMVVTINPKQKKSTIVSLDRDILAKIVGYGSNDKLNHAYAFGGVEMSMDTIETLLDIPLDHYVSINMRGLKDLIDAVGGIEVNNKIDFTLDGIHVKKGKQTLDGEKGLAYARMRYEDPEGDVGRQKRQREVVTKILRKAMSINGVGNYRKILKAVEKNMKTDLTWEDMMDVGTNYLSAFDTIKQKQLVGKSQMIDEVYYQILGTNELLEIQNTLKKQLGQTPAETLPNLEDDDAYSLFYDDSDGKASEDTSQFAPGYDDPSNYDNSNGYEESSSVDDDYSQYYDSAQTNQGYDDPNAQYGQPAAGY
ncbi:LCP family glycopolymer transferase [Enterococcus dongliensis]|uniref:LCP family glycopolymer transferase n=1 Tax=Enterococcus dongliensis TaxID=2559925 RepID=UPI00288C89DC|nr:LCP family protein [Enterococcus dongliensis]MDT2603089.1 LCP family protein [Enterococcus dongliensis]MDT2675530.1 LCP family protein [Enterococcus dongliensis]